MIRQTPFGRFLCWLGVHQIVTATTYNPTEPTRPSQIVGGCVRCNAACGWDL